MSGDDRVIRAQRGLTELGIDGASVEVEGHQRELAAIRVPAAAWERVMEARERVAAVVTEAGFRYAALDVRPADEPE